MRRTLFLISILLVGLLVVGCSSSTDSNNENNSDNNNNNNSSSNNETEEVVELSLGHVVSTEDHYHVFAEELQKQVEEKSDGSMTIDLFPQGQLGDEGTLFQQAQSGTLDILVFGQSAVTNTIKELAVFDLPYLFDSVEQVNEVLSGDIGQKYLDLMSDYDIKGLGYLSAAERNVFSNKPIYELDDFKGLKLRDSEAPSYIRTFEVLGAQPTPMAYDEVYLSLQQGAIDGASAPPHVFLADKFVETSDYYNLTRAFYLPAMAAMSQKTWDGLTEEQQKIIEEAVAEAIPKSVEHYMDNYEDALAEIEAEGVEIIETNLEEIQEKVTSIYDELLEDVPNGDELLKEIQDAVE